MTQPPASLLDPELDGDRLDPDPEADALLVAPWTCTSTPGRARSPGG